MGERAGNNVTHYSCFYGEKKKKKRKKYFGCFPLIEIYTMHGHSSVKQRMGNFSNVQTLFIHFSPTEVIPV